MERSTTDPPAPLYPENKREEVLHSPRRVSGMSIHTRKPTPYFQAVSLNVASMITAGKLLPGRRKELIEDAIAFTDLLIQKVGEKI